MRVLSKDCFLKDNTGDQHWHSGETNLSPMWPRFHSGPGAMVWLRLLLAVALLRGFFSGFSGFLPPKKPNIKFPFYQDRGSIRKPAMADHDVASSVNIATVNLLLENSLNKIRTLIG